MSRRPRRPVGATAGATPRRDETDAPLVPDLGQRARSTDRGPHRPDPFELDLMEDAE